MAVLLFMPAAEQLALPAGPRAVGFTVIERRDPVRRLFDGTARPLQVSLWYPATTAGGEALRYRDYVLVAEPLDGYRQFLAGNGLTRAAIEAWLDAPMMARRDAPAAHGRFPVVLIATGTGGAVQDEAALGECLASHGYLAATMPSPVRLGSRLESEADVGPRAAEQADDLEHALSVARARPGADRERAALVGYSFGARAALLLAARRHDIRALVSLEGGIASPEARDWLPAAFPRATLRIPILHLYGDAPPDFALLDSLKRAPQRRVTHDGLGHLDFITFGLARAMLPAMADEGAPARLRELRAVAEETLAFLGAHLRRRASR
jgi:dienelactone hydrolase